MQYESVTKAQALKLLALENTVIPEDSSNVTFCAIELQRTIPHLWDILSDVPEGKRAQIIVEALKLLLTSAPLQSVYAHLPE